jgi:DNA invertase Pin-like site-specific DNA recombinase
MVPNQQRIQPEYLASGKIQLHHRDRLAIVYIRQSSLQQVQQHSESTKLQYALTDKVQLMGWSKQQLLIIDEDLGLSGASAHGRPGFQKLVTEVTLDHVGIIVGIEISRLARSCKDWYQLLEVCALFRTLIADTDGIYDPSSYNDRLLLGLKGTMSEAELHVIKQRMLAGKKAKAKRGELGMQLPMGYIKQLSGEIIKDPDEQAQSTISLIFSLFDKYRTLNAVLKHLVTYDIQMPYRERQGLKKGELSWVQANRQTLGNLLHNPIYAGAYVYGRRPTDPRKKQPGRPSTGRVTVTPQEWEVLIKDKLPAYISWEKYERNLRQLKKNSAQGIGIAKHGSALLPGLLICGHCGLRMAAHYSDNGSTLRYACYRMAVDYGEKACQSLLGNPLDQLIEAQLLAAIEPSALELSLQTAENYEQERQQQIAHWQQRLVRAHYEAERAYRQYNVVEPENRLVSRTLEKKWEETLTSEKQLKQDYELFLNHQAHTLSESERNEIRALASDIPKLWKSKSTTQIQRKNIVRLLIEKIKVSVIEESEKVEVEIYWAGGHKTETVFNRPVGKLEQLSYYRELLERAESLYHEGKTRKEIATILNHEGWQTAKQKSQFSTNTVGTLLARKGLASNKKKPADKVQRKKDEYTMTELSQKLNIPTPTLYQWMKKGQLTARRDTQVFHKGIWLIQADKEEIKRLQDLREQPKQWIYHSRVEKVD